MSKEIQKVMNIASKCLNCKLPSCNSLCSLRMPINKILNKINNNQIEDATKLIYRFSTFPFICGLLCDHEKKCLSSCILNKINKPVEFHVIENILGSNYIDNIFNNLEEEKNYKVAIIGGGICGLTIAIRLLQYGIKPVIYEKYNNLGGILTNALPTFRYNKEIFLQVIKFLETKIEIHYNQEFGKNLFFESLSNFDDVVLCYGCYNERSNFKNTYKAINLLHDKNLLNTITNKKIIVIGGGNVAMDIARSLKRKNNDVIIAYRRNMENSPASRKEISDAHNEGIIFKECISPLEIIYDNKKIIGMKFQKMGLYNDGTSRLMFKPLNEEVIINGDIIVEATGSSGNFSYLKEVYPDIFDLNGWVKTDNNFQTSVNHLYVGGDLQSGPRDFCSAINSGETISSNIINNFRLNRIKGQEIIIGGSFNPPTIAHQLMIKELLKLEPSKIIILPNGESYHINFNDKKLISFDDRYNMCKLLISDLEGNFEISKLENNKQFNGTYYTLKSLNHPYFSMGSDCLYDLHKWIKYKELVKENYFIVFTRSDDISKIKDFIKSDDFLYQYESHFILIEMNLPEVSSSKFRDTLDYSLTTDKITKYIKENKLFEVNNDK